MSKRDSHEDRIWEMYHSNTYQPSTRRACRERVHWLAERARGRVLDIGCSQGLLPILLAREGTEVVGVDIEASGIEFAGQRLREEPENVRARVRFLLTDACTWEPNEQFDTVVLSEVLEHISKPQKLLDVARRLLVDEGRLLVTVPLGWLEHPDHRQAFLPTALIGLLERDFGIEQFEIAHDKICVVARRGASSVAEAVDSGRLLEAVEQSLLAMQYRHIDRNAVLRRRIDTLETSMTKLRETKARTENRVEELAERRRQLNERIKVLEGKVKKLQSRPIYVRWPSRVQLAALLSTVRKRAGAKLRGSAGRSVTLGRPLTRHVYEGSYRVDVPNATAIAEPVDGRILHLLEYSLPHQQNGYTLRSLNIVRAQKRHGWDPIVVTKPGFPENLGDESEPDMLEGVPHYRLPGRGLDGSRLDLPRYTYTYVTEAARLVEMLRPALVQAGSNFRNAYAAMELARNYRLPFVYEVRGLWEETRVANRRLSRQDKKYEQLVGVETYCMRTADAVVTLGESLRAELVRRGIDADKIFLVPNAVDFDAIQLRPAYSELRASLGLEQQFVVGYIGSVSRLESLDVLIEAIAILRRERNDIAALIVGSGSELGNLQNLAAERGVSDSVRFAGSVPHADIADYYAITDAIACTRGRERVCELVTPLKPYESMAYRKPVIVSDIPALREMVEDGKTGRIVPAEDPHALAGMIAELADRPDDCEALTERAYQWVREHRNWQRVTEGYRLAYDHATKSFARRANG